MEKSINTNDSWYMEWAWVGGYGSISTLIFIFNILIFFSVGKNKFLHYSFHYVIVVLSLRYDRVSTQSKCLNPSPRNILRVVLTLCLVFLAKLIQTPWLLKATFLVPTNSSTDGLDFTQSMNMKITCEVLSMTDHILMATLMFYMAALSLYMFCRHPNPSVSELSETSLKVGNKSFSTE